MLRHCFDIVCLKGLYKLNRTICINGSLAHRYYPLSTVPCSVKFLGDTVTFCLPCGTQLFFSKVLIPALMVLCYVAIKAKCTTNQLSVLVVYMKKKLLQYTVLFKLSNTNVPSKHERPSNETMNM